MEEWGFVLGNWYCVKIDYCMYGVGVWWDFCPKDVELCNCDSSRNPARNFAQILCILARYMGLLSTKIGTKMVKVVFLVLVYAPTYFIINKFVDA
jgi:hypothetical protein